jgi:apolipoprotein N-acyltransferase
VDFLQRRFGPYRFWRPGLPTAPLATRAGLAGVLVCNEAWLPQLAAERVTEGAEYLVSPSNDGWVGGGWTPWPNWGRLMVDVSALRAVEQRRYMVRASTSGPSAIIDPWGRVRARTEPGVAAILIGSIRPRSDRSPYGRVGDLFAGLCLVTVLGALSWRRLFRRGTDSVD